MYLGVRKDHPPTYNISNVFVHLPFLEITKLYKLKTCVMVLSSVMVKPV